MLYVYIYVYDLHMYCMCVQCALLFLLVFYADDIL